MFLGHIGSLTARDAFALGMTLKGYDPGLSVQSALRLPRSLNLADSIIAAVSGADYISLNIPYIKEMTELMVSLVPTLSLTSSPMLFC